MVLHKDWTPGAIVPDGEPRTIPVSIRMPKDLYDGLGRYARRVGARRTYLILECLRRLLEAHAKRDGAARPARPRGKRTATTARRPKRR